MVLSMGLIVLVLAILFVGWVVFFVLPIPPQVRTILAVIAAVVLLLWVVSLTGLVAF